ncbi:MAG: hypothetical protein D6706_18950, partial [Chloroflexi bacterium]
EVRNAAIDQALADGLITEQQAEMLRNHPGKPGRFGGPCPFHNGNGPDSSGAPAQNIPTGVDG